ALEAGALTSAALARHGAEIILGLGPCPGRRNRDIWSGNHLGKVRLPRLIRKDADAPAGRLCGEPLRGRADLFPNLWRKLRSGSVADRLAALFLLEQVGDDIAARRQANLVALDLRDQAAGDVVVMLLMGDAAVGADQL